MPTDLVTVRTFNAPTPAKLAATELEEANIRVRVVDDEIVAADPLLSQAFGGVKLKVPESQVERAREILTDARDGTLDDRLGGEETEFEPLSDPEREEWDRVSQGLRCPSCGDSSVGLDGRWLAAWILASLGAWWSGPLWPAAVSAGGVALGFTLFQVGLWLLILRRFPLACKECGHRARRSVFDPAAEL